MVEFIIKNQNTNVKVAVANLGSARSGKDQDDQTKFKEK